MLLEEFYKYNGQDDSVLTEAVYLGTLHSWLIYNDFVIYENIMKYFEEKEEYMICDGIHRALSKIDDVMAERFKDAEKIKETEGEVVYSHEEHQRVSRLVFEDIIKEIYERKAEHAKKDN